MRGIQKSRLQMAERRKDVTASMVRELLTYDPHTGLVFWNPRLAGSRHNQGYVTVNFGKFAFKVHHLAWLLVTGEWPDGDMDHINGVRDDNRWENLRIATPQQNCFNRGTRRDNKSGHTGVVWYERNKKWGAYVDINIKNGRNRKWLGLFKTFEEAVTARRAAAAKIHGEFARYK